MAVVSHAGQHANANDAIEAIETELGTNPSGASASVKDRLDTLVVGPGSATDNALVRFDGTDGKTVQNSGLIVDDSNNVSGVGTFASGAITSSAAVQAAAASGFVSGASGPKVGLSGTGNPEGVVTAPVGSTYIDTAATTGAITWIKAAGSGSSGWVVEYGDTGARNIAAEATSVGTRTITTLQVRRVGRTVTLRAEWADTQTNPSSQNFVNLPVGFRPVDYLYRVIPYAPSNSTAVRNVLVTGSGWFQYGGATNSSAFSAVLTWITNDAWPSSLPGSAA